MAIEKDELIAKIKEVLKPELTQISYETWILPLGIRSIDGNHIIFTTTSEYQQDFIENKYTLCVKRYHQLLFRYFGDRGHFVSVGRRKMGKLIGVWII